MQKQIAIIILCYIIFNIKHIQAQVVGCQPGTYCPYGVGLLNANLVRYYSFWANNRLLDSSGVGTSLSTVLTPTYTSDCKWANAQCAVVTASNYHTLPTTNYATMSAANGWGICMWYMYDVFITTPTTESFWYVSGGTNCQIILRRQATSGPLLFSFTNNNVGYSTSLTQNLGQSTWNHVCVTNKGRAWSIFENGFLTVSTTTAAADINSATTATRTSFNSFQGKLDEIRVYNTFLTNAAVMNIFSMRNIQCPVGTYQDQTDQTSCKTCVAPLFQSGIEKTTCIASIPIGSYSQSTSLSTNNNLIGHWSFQPGYRLTDVSGFSGDLQALGTPDYVTNCVWNNAECYANNANASNYLKLPALSLGYNSPGYLSGINGFSICTWFNTATNGWIFESRVTTAGTNLFKMTITSLNKLQASVTVAGTTTSFSSTASITNNIWYHTCLTNMNALFNIYLNGAWIGSLTSTGGSLPSSTFSHTALGQTVSTGNPSTVPTQLDGFRYYNKLLSNTEVSEIYTYSSIACPTGTFQDQTNQNSCTPCPIGTSQASTGQTACTTCANAISPGTASCSILCQLGPLPSSSFTNTPGMAMLTTSTNYISFNCPSGTYYPQVFNLVSLTAGCNTSITNVACTTSCCMWSSSQFSPSRSANKGFDGILDPSISNLLQTLGTEVNQYVGIDFGTQKTISYVVIFDRMDALCDYQNSLQIYVGNTLYNNRVTLSTTGQIYPVASQNNTLCYTGNTQSCGYRMPLVAQCVATGQYLYVVKTGVANTLNLHEVIVVDQPVCTNCSAGTYSLNNGPTTVCSKCPAGYYQTGIGATFCNQCPTGTYQTIQGSSYCISDTPAGSYDQMGLPVTNLIAHYSFIPTNRIKDLSGMTGDLTSYGSMTPPAICQWVRAECVALTSTAYYSIPSMNMGMMSIATGFSICFWFNAVGGSNTIFLDFAFANSVTTNRIIISILQASRALQVVITNSGSTSTMTGTTNAITYGIWTHACITNTNRAWVFYLNGVQVNTFTATIDIPSSSLYGSNFIGQSNDIYPEPSVQMDSIRIYNKVLTDAEESLIYQYRMYSCPTGSYQDSTGKDACIPCPVGTYQISTGQTACVTCDTYATYPGSILCASSCLKGPQPSTGISTTNGTAMLTTGGNYISFNCPGGTYYNGVYPITSLTTNCVKSNSGGACTVGQCCIWGSSQSSTSSPSNAFDGIWGATDSGNFISRATMANPFLAIDFVSQTNVVNIIIFDRWWTPMSHCSRMNNLLVYIGNTLYSGPPTPAQDTGGSSYPIASQDNTLCYTGNSIQTGYRNPLTIQCNGTGRYVYIVQNEASNTFSTKEVIVTGESVCTPCAVGTFSTYVQPNIKCTACPTGTYQSLTGMSYCTSCPTGSYQDKTSGSTCKACPFGYYQPDTGASTCIAAPTTGQYSVSSSSVVQCPIGSYQDESPADTCKPCGLGTYQNVTGQTSCIFCNGIYNSFYGSITCPQITDSEQCRIGVQPSTALTTTPGMAMLTVGANYISFNCPSGTYSTTVSTLTPLTVGCSSSYYTGTYTGAVTCSTVFCAWMSSQFNGSTTTPLLYDGILNFANSWNIATTQGTVLNEFIAIDFSTSRYIDSVLIFDVIGLASECSRQDNLQIYVGNTSYTSAAGKIASSAGYSYPVASQLNTLCYTGDTSTQGYRQPLNANCKTYGRYLYIVSTSTDKFLELNEIIVLGQPACTLCPAGTYSVNTIPNTECSLCPGGTYSTGSGMTSKSACTICPLGTYSTGMGSTASSVCTTCS